MTKNMISELLQQEWDVALNDVDMFNVTRGSNKSVWWRCSLNHSYLAKINNRSSGSSCPICSGKKVLAGFNDFATLFPEAANDWDYSLNLGRLPTEYTRGSAEIFWWTCSQDHKYDAPIPNKLKMKNCPICSGTRIMSGLNDLATLYASVVQEWDFSKNTISPDEISYASNRKVWWKCRICAHGWIAIVANRTLRKTGCPACSGTHLIVGLNDLKTTHPHLIDEWSDKNMIQPYEVSKGTNLSVWWKCINMHEWYARINDRATKNDGCIQCFRLSLPEKSQSILQTNPPLISEWDIDKNLPRTPEGTAPLSNKSVCWVCSINPNHLWSATVANRTRGSGCPVCWASTNTSKPELEISEILDALGIEYRTNDRSMIGGLELDFYIPSLRFAIEFNGVYWHSEANGKGKEYHFDKLNRCKNVGINLFQIWEDDWIARKPVVIRSLLHRIGSTLEGAVIMPDVDLIFFQRVPARTLDIRPITTQESNVFLRETHMQGSAKGTHYIGAFDTSGRLRAVMVLTSTQIDNQLLISRYATIGIVQGGFSKLLGFAKKEYRPKEFITFADNSVSMGALYQNNGFSADKAIAPDYSYLVGKERKHKFNYRLKRFERDPALRFEKGLTEKQLASLNGLYRIWDSGKTRYSLKVT